jgi:hypothetical protein
LNVELTLATRKRGFNNAERSAVLRERVEDYLASHGAHRNPAGARADFATAAVRTATRFGMRTWRDSTKTTQEAAERSLGVLLGEVVNVRSGKNGSGALRYTGVNDAWVLDIWEATLEHYVRDDPFTRELARKDELVATEVESTRAELDRLNGQAGVQVFRTTDESPVGMRIIEAYLARDDDAIMRIAMELEAM